MKITLLLTAALLILISSLALAPKAQAMSYPDQLANLPKVETVTINSPVCQQVHALLQKNRQAERKLRGKSNQLRLQAQRAGNNRQSKKLIRQAQQVNKWAKKVYRANRIKYAENLAESLCSAPAKLAKFSEASYCKALRGAKELYALWNGLSAYDLGQNIVRDPDSTQSEIDQALREIKNREGQIQNGLRLIAGLNKRSGCAPFRPVSANNCRARLEILADLANNTQFLSDLRQQLEVAAPEDRPALEEVIEEAWGDQVYLLSVMLMIDQVTIGDYYCPVPK